MKNLIIVCLLFCFQTVFSQGEANNWYFGDRSGIRFYPNISVFWGKLNTIEGCSTFSDRNGNLLFYSDGVTVWDRRSEVMLNGTNLNGDPSSTQSAIIVPHPTIETQYYLFTVGANNFDNNGKLISQTKGLFCYTIDMRLNNGYGAVYGDPIDLSIGLNQIWTEKITSVQGGECNTYWVISVVNDQFVSYKIDANGLDTNAVISKVDYWSTDPRGYLKVSPNGKYVANATYDIAGNLMLYTFNDVTGQVNNDGIKLISEPKLEGFPYGVEFSPFSSKLYCSTFDSKSNITYQFNLSATNILASKTIVNTQAGYRGALQLAPNGKIYATVPFDYNIGTNYLNAINEPEKLGISCNYKQNELKLMYNSYALQGLPPFVTSFLSPPVKITNGITEDNLTNSVVKLCMGESYILKPEIILGATDFKWTFKGVKISSDPTLAINNIDNLKAGVYTFEANAINDCGVKLYYVGKVYLEAYKTPAIKKPLKIFQQDNDGVLDGFMAMDLSKIQEIEFLNNLDKTQFEIKYFSTKLDAENNTNALKMPYSNKVSFGNETIFVRIHNQGNSNCYIIESFDVQISESANPPDSISNLITCDSTLFGTETDGFEIFDLTLKKNDLLKGLNPAKISIKYYSDSDLTQEILNPTSFKNTTKNNQTIYVQYFSSEDLTYNPQSSFEIEVSALPDVLSNYTLKQCDADSVNDGITNFLLTKANDYISKGNNNYLVSYYLTLNDAINKTQPIALSQISNKITSTVIARIENSNGCFKTCAVNLTVTNSSLFPADYLKEVIQCETDEVADGKSLFDLKAISTEILNLFPSSQNLNILYYRNFTDALLGQNSISTDAPYLNETSLEQTLIIKVENMDNGECFQIGPHLKLIVNERPNFELESEIVICNNSFPFIQKITNPTNNYAYQWMNHLGEIISNQPFTTIENPGNYSVIATSDKGCKSLPKTIEIKESKIANISVNDITVDDTQGNNTISISTANLGIGTYEFSLNDMDGPYQTEPIFKFVAAGFHTIFIRDINNCGIVSIDISVVGYQKFFTPNNDGYNDTWNLLGIDKSIYPQTTVTIFDRFGKFITKINQDEIGWDGYFNGVQLPTSDYWFSAELTDNQGNIITKKGHFSLIRR